MYIFACWDTTYPDFFTSLRPYINPHLLQIPVLPVDDWFYLIPLYHNLIDIVVIADIWLSHELACTVHPIAYICYIKP